MQLCQCNAFKVCAVYQPLQHCFVFHSIGPCAFACSMTARCYKGDLRAAYALHCCIALLLLLQVHAQNSSDTTVFAYLHVDGQQVAQTCIDAHSEGTFTGAALPSNRYELKELLFSLPRFVTQAEKKRAGITAVTASLN
jgi:hypothetical protein